MKITGEEMRLRIDQRVSKEKHLCEKLLMIERCFLKGLLAQSKSMSEKNSLIVADSPRMAMLHHQERMLEQFLKKYSEMSDSLMGKDALDRSLKEDEFRHILEENSVEYFCLRDI